MKHFLKKAAALISICMIVCTVSAASVYAAADPAVVTTNSIAGWPQAEDINSTTGVLIEASTGTVLFNKSMDKQMYPASITKILTTLVTLENGNMSDSVTMTQTGVDYAVGGSSNQGTRVGEVFTLEQLLYGTMLASANDMATQMGEHIGGSIENFCAMMNERSAALGCTGTHFTNACGMPDPNHMTTAHDMALIMRAAVQREDFRTIAGTHAYMIPPTNMSGERYFTNHNPLLTNPDFAYGGLIGGKNGYTDAAMSTLVNAASRDGMTMICVALHAVDAPHAANDNIALLDYGFNNFEMCEVLPAEYCENGMNRIVVPKGVKLADCTEKIEEYDAEGTPMIRQTYTYSDYTLGTITLTKEKKAAYEKALADAQRPKEEKKNEDESAEQTALESSGPLTESVSAADSGAKSEAQRSAEERVRMVKMMFGTVGITVGLLFLLFVILLIRYIVKSKK